MSVLSIALIVWFIAAFVVMVLIAIAWFGEEKARRDWWKERMAELDAMEHSLNEIQSGIELLESRVREIRESADGESVAGC